MCVSARFTASDTQAACMNFLNALEKIPEVTKSHQGQAEKLRVDLPTLQAIAASTWGKEDELKALKAELGAPDQKITAALAPKHGENDVEKDKQFNTFDSPYQSEGSNKWLVAEPRYNYISVINRDQPYSRRFGL